MLGGVEWFDCLASCPVWSCSGASGELASFAPGRSETRGPQKESADQRTIKRGTALCGAWPPPRDHRPLSRARGPAKI